MCDYSLHIFPNRLAVEGENLIVHRFGGASLGLASPADLPPVMTAKSCDGRSPWARIADWFKSQRPQWEAEKQTPAVCVPPGARLILRDIPKNLQRELGVGEVEIVTFAEISADVNTYRDAIRFENNRQVLLQAFREGQRVTVVSLSPATAEEPVLVDEYSVR
jgi:hypothetical protein